MTEKNSEKYLDVLPLVMQTYNHRYHRIIEMTPALAELEKNWSKVRLNQEKNKYSLVKRKKPKFFIGKSIFIYF